MASESVAGVMHGDVMLMDATSEFDPRCDSPASEKSGPAESDFSIEIGQRPQP
jgi:hypothetical protein